MKLSEEILYQQYKAALILQINERKLPSVSVKLGRFHIPIFSEIGRQRVQVFHIDLFIYYLLLFI